ncbi:hypothetical protein FEM48_Zijuj02G0024100 [Ziziphus jujuba var. spinosa]|uniref:Uncharacterized protein n=1 Tax=Ziziphus jujuba var. spinosa TaxID=714518 RepID=A0A978VT28_ZIZJJ|nr:hypothetical protein FEM48_Zijuj02G0024100 [Ziziphus jujuba var. spinosa]
MPLPHQLRRLIPLYLLPQPIWDTHSQWTMVILINFVFGCFLVYPYDPDPNPMVLSNCCTLDSIAMLAVLGRICIPIAAIRSLIKIASWSRSLTLGNNPKPLLLLLQTPTKNLIKIVKGSMSLSLGIPPPPLLPLQTSRIDFIS